MIKNNNDKKIGYLPLVLDSSKINEGYNIL